MKKCAILFCILIITLILAAITERQLEDQQKSKLVIAADETELIANAENRP
ncbi:hypothetical protein PP178_02585 [Zeaxanthinibacter sp. PT1]|uniref:hypothetical protein n=1 Tax=Zeaxanthinibacter TaxID=561554 RepID=UPI00234ACF34|nr:hypothetical protein [Zeaxanthinibacter sp. PT1]MDC6350422.1 hypothetical protein [Zeaxanthinibacter sp. PT1]